MSNQPANRQSTNNQSVDKHKQHAFPIPKIPLAPVISNRSLSLRSNSRKPHKDSNDTIPSLLDIRYRLNVTSGRAAISLALEHIGVTAGDDVLIPAFHCESMISPVRWRKANPIFYQVNLDTTINLDDIKQRCTPQCKVIIATHYFGFLQDFFPLRRWCNEQGILFIEDCAHAFFGKHNRVNVGDSGDFAIASSMKFFPVYDGGLLTSNNHNIENIKLNQPARLVDMKAFFNTIERSTSYGRLGSLGWVLDKAMKAKTVLWRSLKSNLNNNLKSNYKIDTSGPSSSEGAYGLDENWIHVGTTRSSKWLLTHSDLERITYKRRKNYRKLDAALGKLPGVRPLFAELPEDCVPLVYPLFFQNPEHHFQALKKLGVPIWRFGEYLDEAINPDLYGPSYELSHHVFQFPCHQELLIEELEWMIQEIKNSLTNAYQDTPDEMESVSYQRLC